MSIRVMSHVWEHSKHKGGDLLLLLAIADHADDLGQAFPSIKRLAQKTRMTERNVQLVIKRLTHSQELVIHAGEGPHGCHLFELRLAGTCPCNGGDEKISPEKISPSTKSRGEKSGKISHKISPKPSLDPSEDLNLKEGEGTPLPPARRCPVEYEPTTELRAWAREKYPRVDFEEAVAAMRDCEFQTAHRDWHAVMRNWIRREAKWTGERTHDSARLTRDEQRAMADAQSTQELEDLVYGRNTRFSVWAPLGRDGAGVPGVPRRGSQSRLSHGAG